MARLLFGSPLKVLFWLFFLLVVMIGFAAPAFLLFALILLIAGPGVAIPAIIAQRGKHVVTTRGIAQTSGLAYSVFAQRRTGRHWVKLSGGLGELNYQLTSAKSGCEPVVSVEIDDAGNGNSVVHVWMSEWTQGGLNGGKGTPFWVWGGTRAMVKVSEAAKVLSSSPGTAFALDQAPTAPSVAAGPPSAVHSGAVQGTAPVARPPAPKAATAPSDAEPVSLRRRERPTEPTYTPPS